MHRQPPRVKAEQCEIGDDALAMIVEQYTREAGVRNLEREIDTCSATSPCASPYGSEQRVKIAPDDLRAILASLMTGRSVRSDVAMIGEISLRGLVLPIGGVKGWCSRRCAPASRP